jgi:hypothetical protein
MTHTYNGGTGIFTPSYMAVYADNRSQSGPTLVRDKDINIGRGSRGVGSFQGGSRGVGFFRGGNRGVVSFHGSSRV